MSDRHPRHRRPRRRVPTARLLLFALVLPLVAGCDLLTGPDQEGPPPRIETLPRQLTAAEQELIRASNGFAFELLRETDAHEDTLDGPPNRFLSPLSASMALGMTLNGADGATYDEMRSALGLDGLSQEEINASYSGLIDLLRGLDPQVDFRLGNSIWLEETYPVREDFRSRVRDAFDAEAANVDFQDPATAGRINRWVEEATRGKITAFVRPEELGELIALLANAVYFKGDWRDQFDPAKTAPADFRLPDGSTVQVPMMQQEEMEAGFAWTRDYAAADLRYGGAAFSMTVVLPARGVSVDSLVGSLDQTSWDGLLDQLDDVEVDVALPKLELSDDHQFETPLRAMGVEQAFDPAKADFSRLSDRALQDQLFLQWVKQQTFVSVDEEGTEAAAAMGAGVGPTSGPPTFRADRPFLFAIRERLSGTILFLGTVEDPTAG